MEDKGAASGYEDINKRQLSGNLRGALLMVLSGVGFTVYLLLTKLLSADVHPVFLAFGVPFWACGWQFHSSPRSDSTK